MESEDKKGPVLQLFTKSNVLEGDATITISWCVPPDTLEELRRRKVKNPMVFLIAYHEDQNGKLTEMNRVLSPLRPELAYMQFFRSGKHYVVGNIVWPRFDTSVGELKNYVTKITGDKKGVWYVNEINVYDDDIKEIADKRLNFVFFQLMDMMSPTFAVMNKGKASEVPSTPFAKEPSEWEKWLVNLWHKRAPRDQCEFRARRFITYPWKAIAVFLSGVGISFIFSLLTLVIFLLGAWRLFCFRAIFRPFKYLSQGPFNPEFSEDEKGSNPFLTDREKRRRTGWGRFLWFLIPGVQILFWFVLVGLYYLGVILWSFEIFRDILCVTGLVLLFVSVPILGCKLISWLISKGKERYVILALFVLLGLSLSLLLLRREHLSELSPNTRFFGGMVFVALAVVAFFATFKLFERLVLVPGMGALEKRQKEKLRKKEEKRQERRRLKRELAEKRQDEKREIEKIKRETMEKIKTAQINEQYENMKDLVCSPDKPIPETVWDLPPERRTVKLYFWAAKRAVCKPFQR